MILRRAARDEILRLRSIADYQFGYPAGSYLIPDDAVVGVSPTTRRIREVYSRSEGLIAVLRAHDYLFSLSPAGALRLLKGFPSPRLRVIVGASEVKSKSIPCGVIKYVDETLRAGDEAIVVTEDDKLIGIGRLRLSPMEILEEECWGEAVRLRKLVKG